MKRLIFIALAAAAALSPKAYDDLPPALLRHVTDTDAHAFFKAMNDFEDTHADGLSLATYDSYPDGTKVISRRIDFANYFVASIASPIDRICAVFDSITAIPNENRLTVRNIDGNRQSRVYKLKESVDDMTIDLSATSTPGSTSACVIRDGNLVIAQNWTIPTGRPQGKPDLKALNDAIADLAAQNGAFTTRLTLREHQNNAGDLRRRYAEPESDNKLVCRRITIPKATTQQWIDLHHVFMDYFGADGDLSLTYIRNQRMVTLVDMASKRIYAARFSSNRGLVILVGDYTGEPFLPNGWDTAR